MKKKLKTTTKNNKNVFDCANAFTIIFYSYLNNDISVNESQTEKKGNIKCIKKLE